MHLNIDKEWLLNMAEKESECESISCSLPSIKRFAGQYRWLSNFWPCNGIVLFGKNWPTLEHAYQVYKIDLKHPKIEEIVESFLFTTAGEAKKLGRTIPIRADWEDIKEQVMYNLLLAKFNKNANPTLYNLLKNTNPAYLEEGNNWHDTYWGKCYCKKHNGVGDNKLGNLLMKIRGEIYV